MNFPDAETTAVINVDLEFDFLSGGALEVPDAEAAIPVIERLVNTTHPKLVISTRDLHSPNHCSISKNPTFTDGSWPEHCIAGTHGSEIHPDVLALTDIVVDKGTDDEKEAYSGFEGTDLEQILRNAGVEHVVITGVATDYCVGATARDALSHGFKTTIIADGVKGIDPQASTRILWKLHADGAKVQSLDQHLFRSR